MNIKGKVELIDLLDEIIQNCGDTRGRDGEYLDIKLNQAQEIAENLNVENE